MTRTARLLTGSVFVVAMLFVTACGSDTSTADKSPSTEQSSGTTTLPSSESEQEPGSTIDDAEKSGGSFCDKASGYQDFAKTQLGKAMGGVDFSSDEAPDTAMLIDNMAEMWHSLEDYFSSMAAVAPGPIEDDMGVLEGAMKKAGTAIDEATTEAELEASSAAMDDPDVTQAADHVAKYIKDECGVDFNAEPSLSSPGS